MVSEDLIKATSKDRVTPKYEPKLLAKFMDCKKNLGITLTLTSFTSSNHVYTIEIKVKQTKYSRKFCDFQVINWTKLMINVCPTKSMDCVCKKPFRM